MGVKSKQSTTEASHASSQACSRTRSRGFQCPSCTPPVNRYHFESYLHDFFYVPVALNVIAETVLEEDSHRCFEKYMFQGSTLNPWKKPAEKPLA